MSGRHKKLATRATQSSQEDIGTDMDMQDEIEVADSTRASSRVRKPSQKARESEAVDLVGIAEALGSLQGQMKQLLDANKRTDEANKRFEEANRQLRDENKELKDMIKGLKLDIENMKAYSSYWGQSLASRSQPQSYASVARSGSNSSGSAGGFPKSVSFSSSDSSPRSSMRIILRTASEQGLSGSAIVVELQGSELADTEQARSKFTEVFRAIEGLEELEFLDFKMFVRQNSKAVRMAVTKQEELITRRTAESWTLAIQGARLVAPKWYPIKVDWIEKSLAASADSLGISESAKQRFSTENGVEVKRMAWLNP